jgi:hypothetical protein
VFAVTIALLSLVKPNVSGNCRGYKPGKIVGVEPDYQQNHDMKVGNKKKAPDPFNFLEDKKNTKSKGERILRGCFLK